MNAQMPGLARFGVSVSDCDCSPVLVISCRRCGDDAGFGSPCVSLADVVAWAADHKCPATPLSTDESARFDGMVRAFGSVSAQEPERVAS